MLALYRALWRFATGRRHLLFASAARLTLAEVTRLAIPWLAGQAINVIQQRGADGLPRAGLLMTAVFGVSVIAWALHGPGSFVERNVPVRVRETRSDALFRRLVAPIAERGADFSGGQRQRIALARACSPRATARSCCSTIVDAAPLDTLLERTALMRARWREAARGDAPGGGVPDAAAIG